MPSRVAESAAAVSPRRVALFGSTGSIGRNAVEVIRASQGRLRVAVLSAHHRLDQLIEQAIEFRPPFVVASDPKAAQEQNWRRLPKTTELLVGPDGLEQAAACDEVDVVLAAIVGAAGARSTIAALEAGKTVALANKETLVTAGPIVRKLLDDLRAKEPRRQAILPVDSEHSAIFQSIGCGRTEEVERLVLTASGGPFRTWSREHLAQVTVDEALAHPTWDMGPKITVDSATMMNKALEVIEARWLFDVPADRIRVMIHPQSTIHSMVEFVDGSIVAQLGPPDMKLPIQYALEYPNRLPGPAERFDWTTAHDLRLEPADFNRFPALELGFQCAQQGGTSGAVLNAANEGAVQSFLDGELHFTEIVPACRSILEAHDYEPNPTLQQLEQLDAWAREEVNTWVCA